MCKFSKLTAADVSLYGPCPHESIRSHILEGVPRRETRGNHSISRDVVVITGWFAVNETGKFQIGQYISFAATTIHWIVNRPMYFRWRMRFCRLRHREYLRNAMTMVTLMMRKPIKPQTMPGMKGRRRSKLIENMTAQLGWAKWWTRLDG